MRSIRSRQQSGMTLLSFIVVMAVVGFALYIVMKLFPMYNEYFSVRTALKGVAAEPGVTQKSPGEIEDMFFRRLYISYSDNVKPENVRIEQTGGGMVMHKPLVGNLDVVGKFDTQQQLGSGG